MQRQAEARAAANFADRTPPSAYMVRIVPTMLCRPERVASACIRVRTTSSGCTHTLTSAPDSTPAARCFSALFKVGAGLAHLVRSALAAART